MTKIDVIIPIYVVNNETLNILDNCLKSVLEKSSTEYNLILINDFSPHKHTSDFLLKFKNTNSHKSIFLIENKSNIGFVKTCNIGLKLSSTNDAVLLNSDTIVSNLWLEKLKRCAYSNEKIATATPFSNSATIFSLPESSKNNPIPENYSIDEIADLMYQYMPGRYPEIPTGHGFCLFIKREAINLVGFLDEEKFGNGYGEENDFCCRCILHGYYNALDDLNYIYHIGETSFKGERANVIEERVKLINSIYPFYLKSVGEFTQKEILNTHRKIFKNLILNKIKPTLKNPRIEITDKKNILILSHGKGGGSDRYLNDLNTALEGFFNLFFLISDGLSVTLFREDQKVLLKQPLGIAINHGNEFYHEEYISIFRKIISSCNIDLVHINSFIGSTFGILNETSKMKIPTIYFLHDFNLICPTNHLIDNNNKYCGKCGFNEERENCLTKNIYLEIPSNHIILNHRRKFIQKEVFPKIDLIISPSKNAIDHLYSFYSDFIDVNKTKVIEHAINLETPEKNNTSKVHEGKLNIAILGSIGYHKGFNEVKEIVKNTNTSIANFYLYGESCEKISGLIDKGKYSYNEIPIILAKDEIDLVLLLSIWPETFSYTLSESLLSGIPVIVSNKGAQKDRVLKYAAGWIVDETDTLSIVTLIESIQKDNSLLQEKIISLDRRTEVNQFAEMRESYVDMYSNLINNFSGLRRVHSSNLIDLSYNLDYDSFDDNSVFHSSWWKAMVKIKDFAYYSKTIYILRILLKTYRKIK